MNKQEALMAKLHGDDGRHGIYAFALTGEETQTADELATEGRLQFVARYFKGGPLYHDAAFGRIDEAGE